MYMIDADIDTLCVFPQHITRDHFFTIMYDMLNQIPEVSELTVMNLSFKERKKRKGNLLVIYRPLLRHMYLS